MNDSVFSELQKHVEQAILSVRTAKSHRRKMQRELLAHLIGIYEEEFARRGDEGAALRATKRRFGSPAELTVELQNSVSLTARIIGRLTGIDHSGNSDLISTETVEMHRFKLIGGPVGAFVGLGFVCPQIANLRMHGVLDGPGVGLLFAGIVLTGAGLSAFVWSILRRREPA